MKLWLLDILACPIDKHYPLEMTILNWHESEKTDKMLAHLLDGFPKGESLLPETSSPVIFEFSEQTGGPTIRDDLVLKPTPLREYIQEMLNKVNELALVRDLSPNRGQEALDLVQNAIKVHLSSAQGAINSRNPNEIFQEIKPDLDFLNMFKYRLEIEDAVIRCPECKRWYPVFEAIPQLLPDGIRKEGEDQAFAEKWASKVTLGPLPKN